MIDDQERNIGWSFIRGNETFVQVMESAEEPG
jgi:hypothetical protein